eukprot:TRINITY_DN6121_c0_g1_i1.p1 TRINITY_DN6121_c0_g1~~TRINITY_DN6121_c0_g1_i1.p1  ORF type:complete len:371 (-),score=62.67 TRINITY_DN6121_c0_g1_i1:233-1345(-)
MPNNNSRCVAVRAWDAGCGVIDPIACLRLYFIARQTWFGMAMPRLATLRDRRLHSTLGARRLSCLCSSRKVFSINSQIGDTSSMLPLILAAGMAGAAAAAWKLGKDQGAYEESIKRDQERKRAREREFELEKERLEKEAMEQARRKEQRQRREREDYSMSDFLKEEGVTTSQGVFGDSGQGKSSLINTIMGKKMAKTDSTETTVKPTPYSIDGIVLKFWDLPGAGTTKFPRENIVNELDDNDTQPDVTVERLKEECNEQNIQNVHFISTKQRLVREYGPYLDNERLHKDLQEKLMMDRSRMSLLHSPAERAGSAAAANTWATKQGPRSPLMFLSCGAQQLSFSGSPLASQSRAFCRARLACALAMALRRR